MVLQVLMILEVNGAERTLEVEPRRTPLDALRNDSD